MTGEGPPFNVPPAAFGRFRLLHQIGAGSLGPVFRAEDPASQTAVVIKVLRLNLGPQRAQALADGLAALQDRIPAHPGIVPLVKVGLAEGEPFLVSAYTPAESVDRVLAQHGPTAIGEVLPRLVQIAAGLDFCADASIWHGALHLRDVLVTPAETALVGVGIAPILERAGITLPVRRPFTAPEVVDGAPTSPAADQYALAAVAYEWLYGRRVPGPVGDRIEVPDLDGADRTAMADVFTSALAVDPAKRFESASALVAALADAADGRTGAAAAAAPPRLRRARPMPLTSIVPRLPAEPVDATAWRLSPATGGAAVAAAGYLDDLPLAGNPPATEDGAGTGAATPPASGAFRTRWAIAAVLAAASMALAAGYWTGRGPAAPPVSSVPSASAGAASAAAPVPRPVDPPPLQAPALAGAGAVPALPSGVTAPPAEPAAAVERAPQVTSVERESAVARHPGRVLVRSTPAGATVLVNGEARGVTPLALRDLPFGTYRIAVSRGGFSGQAHDVQLTADRPSQSLEVSLVGGQSRSGGSITSSTIPTPGATRGSVLVESRPVGATVFIDGRAVGVTPLKLDSLSGGPHAVRLERVGYHPWGTTVNVVAGELTRLAASLAGGGDDR